MNDLVAGHVQVGINAIPSVIQFINAGKLLPLAVAAPRRHSRLPQVPTMAEAGVPGFEYEIWYGLFAPTKTPAEVILRLNLDLQKTLRDPDVIRQLKAQGSEAAPGTPDALMTYIGRDTEKWRKVIKDSHFKPE